MLYEVITIWEQTLSCYEGDTEVHFAKISSGALYNAWGNRVDEWQTPIGTSPIWRKTISLLVSEFVEGELLGAYLARHPGKRLQPFQAIHLLYALSKGVITSYSIHYTKLYEKRRKCPNIE